MASRSLLTFPSIRVRSGDSTSSGSCDTLKRLSRKLSLFNKSVQNMQNDGEETLPGSRQRSISLPPHSASIKDGGVFEFEQEEIGELESVFSTSSEYYTVY